MVDPLPELDASDLGGSSIFHEIIDRDASISRDPCSTIGERTVQPKHSRSTNSVVEQQREQEAGSEEVFHTDGVDRWIVSWSEAELHEIEDIAAACYEENLHGKVV